MPFTVVVNRKECLACGAAPAACPEVFVLEGKNRVVDQYSVELTDEVSRGVVPDELRECVERAASLCPVSAIKLET